MPNWRVILAGCDVCRTAISSKRIIVSEKLQARLIASEELQAQLVIWEVLQASSIFAFFVDYSYGRDTAWRSLETDLSAVIT
jgi:hypothetical protein